MRNALLVNLGLLVLGGMSQIMEAIMLVVPGVRAHGGALVVTTNKAAEA